MSEADWHQIADLRSTEIARLMDDIKRLRAEAEAISDALRYCLTGAKIIGCPSPGLMDDALERLERLGGRGQRDREDRLMPMPKRDLVRNVILSAMIAQAGEDNADTFEDDPYAIGVSFSDGEFITIRVGGKRSDRE